MSMRSFAWGALALLALSLAGFGAWLAGLPPAAAVTEAVSIPQSETEAMLVSLKPRRTRPLVAVVGINDATETTDYLVPAGILRRADVAEVRLLATGAGPVKLYPALTVHPDSTLAQFDAQEPQGADYVIVPAMSRDDDPVVLAWLHSQAARGAIVIGVCAGAKVVGAAGLLDGKRATTHWYFVDDLLERNPSVEYVADRRMVMDGGVVTTTGITASMPMMLTLIEAIGGRGKAEAVAHDLGVSTWDARHASSRFMLTRRFATTVLANRLAVWNRERIGLELRPTVDEVSLALVADAWSRTYRSTVVSLADSAATVETRGGVRIVPDELASGSSAHERTGVRPGHGPARVLEETLAGIAARYGEATADVVAMQLEYAR